MTPSNNIQDNFSEQSCDDQESATQGQMLDDDLMKLIGDC